MTVEVGAVMELWLIGGLLFLAVLVWALVGRPADVPKPH